MYTTNEIMFPSHAIKTLRETRGEAWRNLIDHINTLPETHQKVVAFVLMMVRVNGCMECETDSYRAMRGCHLCAQQTLHRSKILEEDLLDIYEAALTDVRDYLQKSGHNSDASDFSKG